jgi:hypothetical protein
LGRTTGFAFCAQAVGALRIRHGSAAATIMQNHFIKLALCKALSRQMFSMPAFAAGVLLLDKGKRSSLMSGIVRESA